MSQETPRTDEVRDRDNAGLIHGKTALLNLSRQLERELNECRKERDDLLKTWDWANHKIPAADRIAASFEAALTKFPELFNVFDNLALKDYREAFLKDFQLKAKPDFQVRHDDEKLDTSTRLGHPELEPWCAADEVVAERDQLRQDLAEANQWLKETRYQRDKAWAAIDNTQP